MTEHEGPVGAGGIRANAGAAERWRAAERQLYSLIVADPDLYTLAVQLVVEARDVLRTECTTLQQLREASASDVLARCDSTARLEAEGFDPRAAFDAARAARMRELDQA